MHESTVEPVTIIALPPHDTTDFLTLPWRVYQRDHLWVPPLFLERKAFLNPRKNPFFQHAQVQLFLARHQGETVGRIAAVINETHDRFHHERAGFFGLFECCPNPAIATALLGAAETWVRARGATFLRGPVNLSMTALDCGVLIEGFGASPVFHSAYNPPYYAPYIEAAGLTKCQDILAFCGHAHLPPSPRLMTVASRLETRRSLVIRPINMRNFHADVATVAAIYNEAWRDNWGYVPITDAEAHHMAKDLKLAVIPELSLIAELEGQAIGCLIALPDLNQILQRMRGRLTPWGMVRFLYQRRRLDTIRVAIMGVKPRYRRLGIDVQLYTTTWQKAVARGIVWGEMAWVLEDNRLMVQALTALGCFAYKRYRLYQKTWA